MDRGAWRAAVPGVAKRTMCASTHAHTQCPEMGWESKQKHLVQFSDYWVRSLT